jgi:hypothetical protein
MHAKSGPAPEIMGVFTKLWPSSGRLNSPPRADQPAAENDPNVEFPRFFAECLRFSILVIRPACIGCAEGTAGRYCFVFRVFRLGGSARAEKFRIFIRKTFSNGVSFFMFLLYHFIP